MLAPQALLARLPPEMLLGRLFTTEQLLKAREHPVTSRSCP